MQEMRVVHLQAIASEFSNSISIRHPQYDSIQILRTIRSKTMTIPTPTCCMSKFSIYFINFAFISVITNCSCHIWPQYRIGTFTSTGSHSKIQRENRCIWIRSKIQLVNSNALHACDVLIKRSFWFMGQIIIIIKWMPSESIELNWLQPWPEQQSMIIS